MSDAPDNDRSDEVPEADALEQDQALVDDEHLEGIDPDATEVPEADALEQSRSVDDPD